MCVYVCCVCVCCRWDVCCVEDLDEVVSFVGALVECRQAVLANRANLSEGLPRDSHYGMRVRPWMQIRMTTGGTGR